MALFKRRPQVAREGQTSSQNPEARQSTISDIDWSDLDNVRAEWPNSSFEHDADLLAWRNGMRMADEDEFPAQRFNEAEYMTRALRHHLYGDGPLSDADVLASVQLVLDLVERFTSLPYEGFYDEFIPKIRRLPLAIIKQRGWQPAHLGGDGSVTLPLDTPGIVAALACVQAPDGRHLEHFFGQT
jgi:hypothetical protein